MAMIGPVQLVVVELQNDRLQGQIVRELTELRNSGTIRILDLLFVAKQQDGSLITIKDSDLDIGQRMAYGAVVGELLGLYVAGEEGARQGAEVGALAFADQTFGLSDADIREIATEILPGKSALFILFEHHWALGLKEAMQQAGGRVRAQGLVRPETLQLVSDLMTDMQVDMTEDTGQPPIQ
jgi:uncharacterized membrane protein